MRALSLVFTVLFGFSLMLQAQTDENTIAKPKVEAKKLSKEGFKILPEALHPMEHQLKIVYEKQNAKNEAGGSPKYFMGIGTATDSIFSQAKTSARQAAVLEIINPICLKMKAIIEQNGGIQEKSKITVDDLLNTVVNKCTAKMMSGPVLADFYKEENGKYIVKRYCTYNCKDAITLAIDYLEAELKNESEELKTALRNPANWE